MPVLDSSLDERSAICFSMPDITYRTTKQAGTKHAARKEGETAILLRRQTHGKKLQMHAEKHPHPFSYPLWATQTIKHTTRVASAVQSQRSRCSGRFLCLFRSEGLTHRNLRFPANLRITRIPTNPVHHTCAFLPTTNVDTTSTDASDCLSCTPPLL